MIKLTKTQVQKQMQIETINGVTIHYSYAEKYQATLSMFKNDRLLVFNYNTGLLYYINEPKQMPFRTQIPKPKNQAANMNVSIAKNTANTNQLHIQFVMKNQKNQSTNVEWSFLLQNKTLAQDWLRVIQAFKNKKIQQMMDAEEKKKQQSSKINNKSNVQNEKVNNAWIHDTLGYGLMEVSNKSAPKPEPEPKPQVKTQPETISPPKKLQETKKPTVIGQSDVKSIQQSTVKPLGYPGRLAESKFEQSPQKSPQKPAQKSPIKQTPIKVPESNLNASQTKNVSIRESNISIRQTGKSVIQGENKNITQSNVKPFMKESGVTPTPPVINQSNVTPSKPVINYKMVNSQQQSAIKGSRLNPNQLSPSIRQSRVDSQIDPRQSKLTLRDELESILERSQMRQSRFESSYISQQQSRVSKRDYNPQNDWNLKFLRKQNQEILIDFQTYSKGAFMSILKQDQSSADNIRVYFKPESFICVANARTADAKKLKAQFRNYHFIMQSCRDNFIVGVPLACLIEYQGLVALVQSLIPEDAPKIQLTQQVLNYLKDLQRYTRIKNSVLKKAAIYDLTDIYDSKHKRLIYVNQLIEYLPAHLEENFKGGFLRPEHILDNVNQFMQGGSPHDGNRQDIKTLHDALTLVQQNVKQLAKLLSSQDIVFANGQQLKTIMHQRGINLKYLPLLYTQVNNKTIKKYIHTFMAAKIGKDYILERFAPLRSSSNKTTPQETVQSLFKLMLEGNSPASNELWKEIALRFKKQYNLAMTHQDLSGAFLLHTLIKLIPGKYDLTKLNDKKAFFRDQGIINKGFVAELIPKLKSFYRFTTQLTDKIIWACRQQKTEQNFTAIIDELKLNSQQIPKSFELSKLNEDLKEYLSYYACPAEFQSKSFSHLKLFESVGKQPPSYLSMSITKNYLKWCLSKEKLQRFKQLIQQTLPMIDYWFDPSHIFHCDFLQLLADYFEMIGSVEESIKFIKESLSLCLKNGATITKKTGQKYFNLAEKQLRAGRKKDSMQNFVKAKNIMQSCNDQSAKYPITLMKLSSLYLNSNDFENCVIYSKKAVQKFQQLQNSKNNTTQKGVYERYCIKAIQIMSRAFQIQNKKNEFYRVAQLCSTKYNKTANVQVFQQMIKISLTAVILRHNQQKCEVFYSLIQKASTSTQSQHLTPQQCLNQLMIMAEQGNIMQKFMFKFQSLERIVADFNSKRNLSKDTKEFLNIVRNITSIVGEDYIYGLIRQKELE